MFRLALTALFLCTALPAADWLSPNGIAIQGSKAFISLRDAKRIDVLALPGGAVERRIELPGAPTGLVFGKDALWVTIDLPKPLLLSIDAATGRILSTLPVGAGAMAPAVNSEGAVAVCARFENKVQIFSGDGVRSFPMLREPYAAVFSKDGRTLYAVNFLAAGRADVDEVAAALAVIDVAAGAVSNVRLPNGGIEAHDLCLSPDGAQLYVVHNLARFMLPTTQVERGWMNTAALTIFDTAKRSVSATVLLDDLTRGAANPTHVCVTGDGSRLLVLHQGTHEVSIIDRGALHRKLGALSNKGGPTDDLTFLSGLRRRVRLAGQGLRSMAVDGSSAWVCGYFTDTLHRLSWANPDSEPTMLALSPGKSMGLERRGEALFHDATVCFQSWQSCSSCHPDGRVDGLNWDLLNDGIANPKNVRSLLGVFSRSPVMSHGVRQGAEVAVRSGIKYILFAVRPESDALALDAFLKAMPATPSPFLVDGKLSPKAERGKELFFSKAVGCAECHPSPLYTDQKIHDVGTRGPRDSEPEFLTPPLAELWRTAPYLHDGRYATLKETITVGNQGGKRGKTAQLSPQDIDSLVEFLQSL